MSEADTSTLPARDEDHERVISIILDLPPMRARLVSLLSRGAVASTAQIKQYLGSKTHPKIAVTHTREVLRGFGMDIKSKYRVGYWMEDECRAKLKSMVDEFMETR